MQSALKLAWRYDGDGILVKRVIMAVIASLFLSACASGLPDPAMLQNALLSNNSDRQLTTGSVEPAERSAASRVLTAVAIERVTGEAVETFQPYN